MSTEKPIISQHLFLYPFVISPVKEGDEFCRKTILKELNQDTWQREEYEPENNFSEFVYFHKYVRESAFNGKNQRNSFCDFYKKTVCPEKDSLVLYWGEKEKNEFYKLPIEFVSLHIFETDIGILTIELLNYDYPKFDEVLKINDLARRIYPPYLIDDKREIPPKGSAIPFKVVLNLDGSEITESFKGPFIAQNGELRLAAHIRFLLGQPFLQKFKAEPVIDDRMYTLCWYGSDEHSATLKARGRRCYAYESSEDWYKFVFVDSGNDSCCQNIDMRCDLIRSASYTRWVEYGTLFGVSRYSFMALTDKSADFIRNHMQRQYYQMAILLLAQRASAISFASRISSISTEIENIKGKAEKIDSVVEKVGKLQDNFIGFVNRLWFEEVTPQEQGIELFEIAQNQMKLKEQIAELKEEMKELFEYVELQYEKKQTENDRELNKSIGILTIIGALFLPLSIFSGLWGMNVINVNTDKIVFTFNVYFWITAILALLVSCGILIYIKTKKRRTHELPVKG